MAGWFLLWGGGVLSAQESFADRYLVRSFSVEEGLPCDFVDDMLVDEAGFVWIATSGGGVCRLDGYDILSLKASSSPYLKSSFVHVLEEDRFRRLWIASEGGLDVLDLRTLEKVPLELPIPENPDSPACACVVTDAAGAVWAKLASTLWRFTFGPDGSLAGSASFTDPRLNVSNIVLEDVDGDGSVWVCLAGVLHKMVPGADGSLQAVPLFPQLELGSVTYVSDYLPMGDRLWISTELGLYQLYRPTGEWKHYVTDPRNPRSLTQNFVSSLAVTPEGRLLASTLHGLNVYNPLSDDFERVGSEVINGMVSYKDRLLIGTETRGLQILSPKSLKIKNFSHDDSDPGSLSAGAVNAIWQEDGGCLWVGTVEGGLNILEPGFRQFVHLRQQPGGLAHNSVSELEPAGDGLLYAGTWGGGIDLLSTRKPYRVVSHLRGGEGQADFVGVLANDRRNGLLWVGSNRGIYLYDPVARSWTSALDEPAAGCIGSCIDQSGHLWIGSLQGLFVFDLNRRGEDGRFPYIHYRYKLDDPASRVEEKICAILEKEDGVMYLGSNGGGFYKGVRQADGTYDFQSFTTLQGLSNDRVRGLLCDQAGNLWVSTDHGLNRMDAENGALYPLFREDGLSGIRFHWNNACQGTDGLLYFGHDQGFSAVDPASFSQQAEGQGVLRFTGIEVGERNYRDPFLKRLSLHEKDRSIVFRFAQLASDARTHLSYRTRMEGFDKDWTLHAGGQHTAGYSTLPHGHYLFRVDALDAAGRVLGSLTLPVEVAPYFYHTWLFHLLVTLAALALVWLGIYLRTKSLRKRQAILEETVAQRTREISRKADELNRQNAILVRQNEELASRKLLFAQEKRSEESRQEEQFMEKALEVLRQCYKDPTLDVNSFCSAMGMSKTSLNSRLQEAAGLSIGQLVRKYRLSVAREMLENTLLNVSEVAYEVGFNDPKYFTRCFSKEYGMAPSSVGKE